MKKSLLGLALFSLALTLQGCLAVAATGAVVVTAGAVVGTGAKVTGAVVGAAIPDGDKDKKHKKKDD